MNICKWLKNFVTRFKIFLWYLATEPIRQTKELFQAFVKLLDMLNKTRTWTYIALSLIIFSLFLGKKNEAGLFLAFLLFVILLWEWERGYFMHRYRQSYREKIRKEVEKNERNKQYPIRDENDESGRDEPISKRDRGVDEEHTIEIVEEY